MNGLSINGIRVNTPVIRAYEQIRLSPVDVESVEHKTYYTIAPMECKPAHNPPKHDPKPYQKRVIHLRHKLDAEPGHIYRLNVAAEEGKPEPTWYYGKDGLTITEC